MKRLRSARDGKVFDLIPEVANRYLKKKRERPFVDMWSFACPIGNVAQGHTLRVLAQAGFELRYSLDEWASAQQAGSKDTIFDAFYVDIEIPEHAAGACRFTFYWQGAGTWENRDFEVVIRG